MTPVLIAKLFAAGLLAWFGALMLLIAIRALRGDLGRSGMLAPSADRMNEVAPERALHMAVFPVIIVYYVLEALHTDVGGAARPSLPDIPQSLLTVLTGSSALYLAGKVTRSPTGGSS